MKKSYIIGLIILLIAVGIAYVSLMNKRRATTQNDQSSSAIVNSDINTTASTSATASYDMDEVIKHNLVTDCWTVVNGSVYDVTAWVDKHPGGREAIISLCGKDGSAAFNNQHGGQPDPATALVGFKIGSLSQ